MSQKPRADIKPFPMQRAVTDVGKHPFAPHRKGTSGSKKEFCLSPAW